MGRRGHASSSCENRASSRCGLSERVRGAMPEDHFRRTGGRALRRAVRPQSRPLPSSTRSSPSSRSSPATGRGNSGSAPAVALPLAERGVGVEGIDFRLRWSSSCGRNTAAKLAVALGDMSATPSTAVPRRLPGRNTIMNLTTQDEQVACSECGVPPRAGRLLRGRGAGTAAPSSARRAVAGVRA